MIAGAPSGTFESVAVASDYACAIDSGGKLACWGSERTDDAPPAAEFTSVVVGNGACARRRDGQVDCWGGLSDPPAHARFQSVTVRFDYACGVKNEGSLACWGYQAWRNEHLWVLPEGPFVSIALASNFACGRRPGGELECWGDRTGRLPDAARHETFSALEAAVGFACALTRDGRLWCWGEGRLL